MACYHIIACAFVAVGFAVHPVLGAAGFVALAVADARQEAEYRHRDSTGHTCRQRQRFPFQWTLCRAFGISCHRPC